MRSEIPALDSMSLSGKKKKSQIGCSPIGNERNAVQFF